MFDGAIKLSGIVTHPVEILFARAGVDDQQIFVFAETVHDHIVNEGALRIEQGRILRLPNCQTGSVIHRDVLHGSEGAQASETDVSHVAYVKDSDARPDRHVLVDDATSDRCGVFDRHIPAVELDHLRAHLAMDSVQCRLANLYWNNWRNGISGGQEKPRSELDQKRRGCRKLDWLS